MSVREHPPQVRQRTLAKARTLLEALPFMRDHRGKILVIKYGGAGMDEARLVRPLAEDVALLQHAGIVPVIVHGGGPAMTRVAERNTEIVANLVAGGVRAVGLSGVDGGLLLARRQTSPDLGFEGEVVHVAADVVSTLTGAGFVPVVASIAVDETTGQAYNVHADVVASELAVALEAEKLVFLMDAPGLLVTNGGLLSELSSQQGIDLLAQGDVVAGGMIPKLESAIRALKAGVGRVHLVDGRVEHSLVLELFTPEGIGTMVTPGP
jgi:acetylglutamate kinase